MWVYVCSGFCIGTAEDSSLRFFTMIHVKDQVFGNVFRESFSGLFLWESLSASSLSGNFAASGIFYLLVEVVYWPCGLKFVYPIINLAFLGIIVKLPAKFSLHSFEWFCLQISSDTKYFFLLSKALGSRINCCYSILFSNLKQERTIGKIHPT